MKKFIGGMVKDPERVDQPEGSYRDALNANLYYQKGAVVNEQGTSPITNVTGFVVDNIIGQCPLTDGRIVLFFNYTFQSNSTSAIGIVNPSLGQHTVLYRDAQLNFQPSNTIEATTKIDVNGNVLVYFTDNYILKATDEFTGIEYISEYNPPRVINITRQETSNVSSLYSNEDYTVEKLDLFLNAGFIPEFRDIQIEEGGGVVSGTYHLALAYVDEDLNRTNYLATSNPVHLVTAQEDSIPTESITGDPQGSQSNKSITWSIDIPTPSNYTHVRPVIIQRFGGGINQESSEFAYELEVVKIPEPQSDNAYVALDITYTGLEQIAASSISEIVIDSVRYETAKSFVQLDNRLYVSNLRARGDIGYQRYANSIKVIPQVQNIPRFDPKRIHSIVLNNGYANFSGEEFSNDFNIYKTLQEDSLDDGFFSSNVRKGYKDVKLSHEYKGYRRSEVYAFYISFVLNDGSETYAYHIPGRESKDLPRAGVGIDERSQLTAANLETIKNSDIDLELSEVKDLYPDTRLFQVTDTQYIVGENNLEMSYWENEDERYPDSNDFDVVSVDSNGQSFLQGNIKNSKVRHHKMPPNKNGVFSFINDLDSPPGVNVNLFGENADVNGLTLSESIKILGITLSDIPIPPFIRDQVQGFKVYYAKRQQQEKTIIGQSIVMPSWYEETVAVSNRMTNAMHGPYVDAWMLKGTIAYGSKTLPKINNIFDDTFAGKAKRAISVFTFHDFNLLKNKHTLSGASHIDVQKILTMRMYEGGNKKKEAESRPYMIDTDWINSTIGNTQWYEWAADGDDDYNNEQAVSVTGDATTDAQPPGVSNYYTSVLVANRYHNPNYVNTSNTNWSTDHEDFGYWLNDYQTILTLDSNSKTYITGSTLLKNSESGAFKNADYLLHFAGESCIALGLVSGLPALIEHRNFTSGSSTAFWWSRARWGSATSGENRLQLGQLNVQVNGGNYRSWPAVYLVNLCSYKTNVYKPFDQQRLVWTGYYQPLDDNKVAGARADEDNSYTYKTNTIFGGDTFVNRHSVRTTSQDYGTCFYRPENTNDLGIRYAWSTNPFENNSSGGASGGFQINNRAVDPYATVFNFYCESDDLLGFRHQGDTSEGVTVPESMFFDASIGADVLFSGPDNDQTKSEHLLYMNNYSAVQDIKVTSPLPKKLFNPTLYPTRTIRSTVDDGSIQDKYRFFLALDYKDIPRNRGEITKLFTLGSILYLHTERSLFVTRGRQQLGLSDSTQAFVGSGDIFEQSPDEMIPTTEGYGGTDCQFASLTTRFGQFFVNRKDRKVYMMGESIEELSSLGMEKWFLDNIPYKIQAYIDLESIENLDAPTNLFGFNAVYDPKYKRIILSKRELEPTSALISLFNSENTGISNVQSIDGGFSYYSQRVNDTVEILFSNTQYFTSGGWTVSYYPELKIWGSRHSYLPNLFANTQKEYYGLVNTTTTNVWEHSNLNVPGNFYDQQYNFEFEYIDNSQAGLSKVFTTIRYWAEVVGINGVYPDMSDKHTSPAFTSFYTYNSTQLSGARDIYYLTNARLVDRFWYINDFRDLSAQNLNTAAVVANNQLNVHDVFNVGSTTSLTDRSMFTEEGVINAAYIDNTKQWYNHKKFVDHFLGVRLISDNLERNLIYLYSAGTKFRQSFR